MKNVTALYSDRIQQVLSEFPEPVGKHKALLATLEEGLMVPSTITLTGTFL